MKRKKIWSVILIVFVSLIAILLAIPYFFVDKINAKIKEEINKRLFATVDYKSFDLSLIRSFPNFSFYLYDLKVVGQNEFAKDTLLSLKQFSFTIDLISVLRGDQLEILSFHLKKPNIFLKVLKDGKTNWDIVKPDSVIAEEKQDTSKSFRLRLKSYSIQNGNLVYQDKQTPMYCEIKNLNHKGSGNLMDEIIDFSTKTQIEQLTFSYAGTQYLYKKTIDAKVDIQLDNKNQKYTFKDNSFSINELVLKFDGFLKLNENNLEMDLKFATMKTDFRSILSLLPGIYTQDFKNIKTDGQFTLNGFAKGSYQENQYPAFGLHLIVENGKFQYPNLPLPAQNIFINFKINNLSGNLEDTEVQLKPFQADLGGNPINIQWLSKGLNVMNIQSEIKAKLDLAKISQFYPIDKTELKGNFVCNAKINGTYSKTSLPKTEADLSLKYGYIKSSDFPASIENLNFEANAQNPSGDYKDTKIKISNFHAELDKQPIDGHFYIENLDNPQFEADITGKLDLEKLMKIYPMEGMKFSGLLDIQELKTRGIQSDLIAGRYDKIPTSGKVLISNLIYETTDMPRIEIQNATFIFTPKEIQLPNYQGKLGTSPVEINGSLSNYMLYVLKGEKIKGNFTFNSPKFNTNEWMTESASPETQQLESTSLEPIEIPENIDFTLSASIQELLYDTYNLKNFKGKVVIKDKILTVENADFDLLGGRFKSSLSYNSQNIKKPEVKMNMAFQEFKIPEAYKSFRIIQNYVPIAEKVEGVMNASFNYQSYLKQDMMPDLATINCFGIAELIDVAAKNFDFIQQIQQLTKLKTNNEINVKNQKVKFKIEDGRLKVEPFDVRLGDYLMNVSGSNGLDQTIDYLLKMTIPTGKAGEAIVQHLSQWTNKSLSTPQNLKLDLKVTGSVSKPIITPIGASTDNNLKQQIKDEAKQKVEDLKKQTEEKAKAEAEKLKQEAEEKARQEAERLKQEAERKKQEAEEKARQEAERLKQEAERKKQEAEEKARQEAERLRKEAEEKAKQKIKIPFR